jgi:hypothetical protein
MGIPRKVRQIAAATEGAGELYAVLFAVADDGTVWRCQAEEGWIQVAALPEAEGCGARLRGGEAPCQLHRRHADDQHWNGVKRWG